VNGRHVEEALIGRNTLHTWNSLELRRFEFAVVIKVGETYSQTLLFIDHEHVNVDVLMIVDGFKLLDTLYLFRQPLLIGAPPGVHPVWASLKNGFNATDFALFYLE